MAFDCMTCGATCEPADDGNVYCSNCDDSPEPEPLAEEADAGLYCLGNNRGPHVPDWSTVNVQSDGGEWYIDINCQLCGRSGCVGTAKSLTDGITW